MTDVVGCGQAKVLCHEKTLSRVKTELEKVVVQDRQVLISTDGTMMPVHTHTHSP